MNISSISTAFYANAETPQVNMEKMQTQSAELTKDLLKINVETMLSLGKMEYIGTLVDMYV